MCCVDVFHLRYFRLAPDELPHEVERLPLERTVDSKCFTAPY